MKVYVLRSLRDDLYISLHESLEGAKERGIEQCGAYHTYHYEWEHDEESDVWSLGAKHGFYGVDFIIEHKEIEP